METEVISLWGEEYTTVRIRKDGELVLDRVFPTKEWKIIYNCIIMAKLGQCPKLVNS